LELPYESSLGLLWRAPAVFAAASLVGGPTAWFRDGEQSVGIVMFVLGCLAAIVAVGFKRWTRRPAIVVDLDAGTLQTSDGTTHSLDALGALSIATTLENHDGLFERYWLKAERVPTALCWSEYRFLVARRQRQLEALRDQYWAARGAA
ncbi:MAG: hypothetical protein H0T65_25085, partial [Deltaproteobacteria bacterium]|nr:hypothetical protein [Deltaproteobacteria bacterium]